MAKRLTQEEFEKRIEEQGNGEYTPLEDYQGANFSVLIKHETCSKEWKVKPRKFFEGSRCPFCSRKLTQAEFEGRVEKLWNGEYTVLGKYQSNETPVLVKHETCGREWMARPSSLFKKSGCPLCAYKRQRLTQEEFEDRVEMQGNGEYTVLGEYQSISTLVLMKHEFCGHTWKVTPGKFYKGSRCPLCSGKLTQEEFENRVKKQGNDEYVPIEKYQLSNKSILIKHKLCGYKWRTTPDNFFRGNRCPLCAGTPRIDTATYVKRVKKIDEKYEVLGEYKNAKEKIKMLHIECGKTFAMQPDNFLGGGQRCPHCKQSRGERDIANFLKNRSIEYEFQKRFKDCKDKRALPFDFYIPALNYCIEFDGIQHFEPVDYFGGEKAFKEVRRRDGIKTKYCKEKGIKLLRIRYDEDVEEKMKTILQNYKA